MNPRNHDLARWENEIKRDSMKQKIRHAVNEGRMDKTDASFHLLSADLKYLEEGLALEQKRFGRLHV